MEYMHHTYISSAVLSLRTKGSLSFSFHDCSNLFNERFEENPLFSSPAQFCSSCCCCCSCCSASSSFATHRLHVSPSSLYGLRQSNLIQWSPCKRLIFGGRGKYYFRVPAYGPDHRGYDVSYSYRESSGRKRIEKCRRGKFGDINLRESQCVSGVNDVEALLSLLSEEVSEEYIGDRGRNECLSERVEIKERENYAGDCQEGKKKNVRSGLLGSSSKCEFESVGVDSRNEESRRMEQGQKCEEIEEAAAVSNGENHRERRASSSFSSYYSLSSMEDFESDNEARDKHGEVVEESSSGSRRKLLVGEARPEGQVIEEFRRHREDAEGQGEILGQRTTATSTGFEWEMRKKSEKKLTEVEEMQSRKQSSPKHLRIAGTDERDYNKGSNYVKKIDNEEERATLEVNLEKGRRKKSSQRDNQVQEQSKVRRNYQEASNIQEICGINVETTSKSQKQFSDREENVMVEANLIQERRGHHRKIYDESSRKENLGRNTQQLVELSEFGNFDMEGVSNFRRHSESGMKIHEEDGKRTSILQLETRSKKQDGSKSIVSSSGAGTTEQQFSSDHNALQRFQSRRGSQDISNISVNVANVSVLHATDIKTITDSQSTFENRIIDQGSTLTSVVKPFQGTRQTDESLTQFKSGNEASRVAKVSKSHERTSHQASSSQASLNWESQERKRLMEEDDQRNLQPIMLPPSAQIVDRGSLLVDQTMEIPGEEVSMETSESGSSAFYTTSGGRTPAHLNETYGRDRKGETFNEPLNLPTSQDALGSAHRLAESSTRVVGEFVEKAKHEVLTSNIQEEETVIVSGLVYEGEKHGGKSSGQFASDRTQLKDQDSLQLSEGSGVKGPSDEIWDVMDPSVEPPEKEAPESSTATENLVVRRTGRSLWSIIANIVRLRWGSHAETPKSTGKSGRKSSSNESVSSEAYFSGHDPDETIDKNGKRERRRMPREETSYPQVQLIQTTSQGQEEASDIVAAKGRRVLQSDTPSPSIRPKSGSTSKGTFSLEGDEYHGFSQDGKGFEVFSSSMEGKESLLVPLHSGGMSSPITKESSGVGETNVSGKGLNEPPEQPVMGKLPGVSDTEGKDWELKRRMLQRNKQVPKDRFDEWEEAYIRDSELRKIDEMFMREALLEAKKAADTWEVPVGAVLVQHGKIIARGYNLVEELRDSTAHAEMICIREASNQLRSWRLSDTTLYVTLEPCPMCAGAILQARIDTLVWGAPNKLLGADGSWIRLFPNGGEGRNGSELTDKPAPPVHPFHPKMRIRRGILESKCAEAMQQFFQLRRRKRDKNEDPSLEPSRLPIANRPSKVLNKLHDIFHVMFCL